MRLTRAKDVKGIQGERTDEVSDADQPVTEATPGRGFSRLACRLQLATRGIVRVHIAVQSSRHREII
jgi:hypothetical protein